MYMTSFYNIFSRIKMRTNMSTNFILLICWQYNTNLQKVLNFYKICTAAFYRWLVLIWMIFNYNCLKCVKLLQLAILKWSWGHFLGYCFQNYSAHKVQSKQRLLLSNYSNIFSRIRLVSALKIFQLRIFRIMLNKIHTALISELVKCHTMLFVSWVM